MAIEDISKAFASDATLATRVCNAYIRCQGDPELSQIFIDIAAFVRQSAQRSQSLVVQEPQSKKRKLETNGITELQQPTTVFECRNVSFTMPARKKLKLQLIASASSQEQGQVRLVDSKTGEVECTLDASDIEQALCLPTPDKAQRQQTYVVMTGDATMQIAFTVNENIDKTSSVEQRSTGQTEGETLVDITSRELQAFLSRCGRSLTVPDEHEFASSIPQSHRKGEKAFHVKAFSGSKDGYLFFLPNGIFFGFKKPLLFFPFSGVESISYTSVLQRTFNLVITPYSEDGSASDVEFSMLDQADFAGIDAYIKAHGLNDASLAAGRQAKIYNVNKPKTQETSTDAAPAEPDDGLTDLQRAEQALQDAEDEEEEDYVASGGESDGEGESSGEEQELPNDEGYADGDDEVEDEHEDAEDEAK